jgi:dTDP-L-rhamnose 4-epimerase
VVYNAVQLEVKNGNPDCNVAGQHELEVRHVTRREHSMLVVVIGGAGFIGSHLVDALVHHGFGVRVVDNLDSQVHPSGLPPRYMNPRAEFTRQDVRDLAGLRNALVGADAVFHLAGAVGVGDSMYRIRHYAEANALGGANLLEIVANEKHSIRKIVLASSVTVYGEGKYSCPYHGIVFPSIRQVEKTETRQWELLCPIQNGAAPCAEQLVPLPTDEEKPATPMSIYAITKRTQEEMFLTVGRTYGVPVAVLRYFNVFGSRQALSNPYTGVAKIFAMHFAQGKVPFIYEDGLQTRDLIHVSDVVQASMLALTREQANGEIFNVGSGQPVTILDMARTISKRFGSKAAIVPSYTFRAGDVRHCWADITKIRTRLGFKPRTIFPDGLEDLFAQAEAEQSPAQTISGHIDLVQRGLIS